MIQCWYFVMHAEKAEEWTKLQVIQKNKINTTRYKREKDLSKEVLRIAILLI